MKNQNNAEHHSWPFVPKSTSPAQTEKTPATTPTQTTKKPPLNKPQAISKAGVNPLPRSPEIKPATTPKKIVNDLYTWMATTNTTPKNRKVVSDWGPAAIRLGASKTLDDWKEFCRSAGLTSVTLIENHLVKMLEYEISDDELLDD